MKDKEDKNLEKLVENLMAATTLENPSIDFTAKVMSGVFAVEKNKSLVYKPLISKWAWYIILLSVTILFAVVFLNHPGNAAPENYFNFPDLNFAKLFSGFAISSMTANVLFAALIMIFLQIILLKNHLNKRIHK